MAAKIKLTRRERRILRDAEDYGLVAVGGQDDMKPRYSIREPIQAMTGEARQTYFDLVEDFTHLVVALRGEN